MLPFFDFVEGALFLVWKRNHHFLAILDVQAISSGSGDALALQVVPDAIRLLDIN